MYACENHRIPDLRSYAAAKAFYEKTERPRGKAWGELQRPLDKNSMHHKRLVKGATGYECVLFRTALVTYHKDGNVSVVCYDSPSSRSFMDAVLPNGLSCFCREARTWIRVTGSNEHYTGETLEFKPHGSSWELVSGACEFKAPKSDLKAMAAVRKKTAPFELWAIAVQRLTGKPPKREYYRGWSQPASAYGLLKTDFEDPALFPDIWDMVKDVAELREAAYWADGAKVFVPVPMGTLPPKGVKATTI